MVIVKYITISIIFIICTILGNLISKRYQLRTKELKEIKNVLNIIRNKIEYTYEPLPEIFCEVSAFSSKNISNIFKEVIIKMKNMNANEAWNESLNEAKTNLNKEDIESIKMLGKALGQTDKEGQVSNIEVTDSFIQMQINKSRKEEEKNSKMYKTLGIIIGLAVVIILI